MKKFEIINLKKTGIVDFAKERNILLKKSKLEWVFFLDSDEEMSYGLKRELSEIFSTPEVEQLPFSGFIVPRRNYFLGRYVGTDKTLRLGRKGDGKWYRKVHEIWRIKGKVGELKSPIIHTTAQNLYDFISKLNFYSTLHAEANIIEGKKSSLFKIVFYPVGKFVESLFTGRGVVFSILQSFHSFLSWSKLYFSYS